jgi:hypothetical protein
VRKEELVGETYEKTAKHRGERLKNALSRLGASEDGRLILWHIIHDICRVNEDVMGDQETVYRHMGRRSAGLQLMVEVEEAGIEIYLNMIKDNIVNTESDRLLMEEIIKQHEGDLNESE